MFLQIYWVGLYVKAGKMALCLRKHLYKHENQDQYPLSPCKSQVGGEAGYNPRTQVGRQGIPDVS